MLDDIQKIIIQKDKRKEIKKHGLYYLADCLKECKFLSFFVGNVSSQLIDIPITIDKNEILYQKTDFYFQYLFLNPLFEKVYFDILILKYFENPEKLSEKLKVSLFQCFRKIKVILRMIQCLRKSISKLLNRNLKINDKTESLLIGIHSQFSQEVKLRYFPKSFSF